MVILVVGLVVVTSFYGFSYFKGSVEAPVKSPRLLCEQVSGFQGDPPVVLCAATEFGFFYFDYFDGQWLTFYYTPQITSSAGYHFTTLPPGKRLRVRFIGPSGEAEREMVIYSDYQECEPPTCKRVNMEI